MTGPMQWTPKGMIPAGSNPATAQTIEAAEETLPSLPKSAQVNGPALKPKNVLALAKGRLREVKNELRRMKALEKERGELERLIAAAENKPLAVVHNISKRSTG